MLQIDETTSLNILTTAQEKEIEKRYKEYEAKLRQEIHHYKQILDKYKEEEQAKTGQ